MSIKREIRKLKKRLAALERKVQPKKEKREQGCKNPFS